MKLNNILIFIIFIVNLNLYAQKWENYNIVEFEGYEPIWKHAVIDSSVLGNFNVISQGDTIYANGFSEFFAGEIFKVEPVFVDDRLIITELNGIISCRGGFVQCLDAKTGDVIWEDPFDRRFDARREFPVLGFINEEDQYQLVCHRENLSVPNNLPNPLWINSLITNRLYNIKTGTLDSRILADEKDYLSKKMLVPFMILSNGSSATYLFKSESFQYILQNFYSLNSFIVDALGHVTDSTKIENKAKLKFVQTNRLFLIPGNKLVNLLYATSVNPETQKDSFELIYRLYDRKLQLLKERELKVEPASSFSYSYVADDYIIIQGLDWLGDVSYPVPLLSFYLFDNEGQKIEEIVLQDSGGTPFYYGSYAVALKLKNEKGLLIFIGEQGNDKFNYLTIIKTDGNGNYFVVKRLKINDKDHLLIPTHAYFTDEGNVLLRVHDNDLDYFDKYQVPLMASVYIMFSGEDIGIKTSAIETVGSKDLDIFPNPASNSISISCENEKSGFIKIFDQLGRLVLKEMSVGCEEKSIDISALDTGLYFVRMTDNEGRIVGRGKFVKE
jgi:hypothetical protein